MPASNPGAEGEAALAEMVALACRILARAGLVREIIGHVSARLPGTEEMLIRCRGEDEYGLAFTSASQVRRLDFSGGGAGLGGQHTAPLELPIHGEIYRARPGVGAVVHAHPPMALLCGLAGLELKPVFGAYDPDALELAAAGIPLFPRSILIDTPALGAELAATLGDRNACLMRGHGITTVGRNIEQATLRAIKLETLATVTWQLHAAGAVVPKLPEEEIASFTRRSGGAGVIPGGEQWLWRHYARLDEEARR